MERILLNGISIKSSIGVPKTKSPIPNIDCTIERTATINNNVN